MELLFNPSSCRRSLRYSSYYNAAHYFHNPGYGSLVALLSYLALTSSIPHSQKTSARAHMEDNSDNRMKKVESHNQSNDEEGPIPTQATSLNDTQYYKSESVSPINTDHIPTVSNSRNTLETETLTTQVTGEIDNNRLHEAESCPSIGALPDGQFNESDPSEALDAEFSEKPDSESDEIIAEQVDDDTNDFYANDDPENHLHLRLRKDQLIGRDRYRIVKKLGEGQSSFVWLATLTEKCQVGEEGDRVAIKVCKRGSVYADAVAYEAQTISYLMGDEGDPVEWSETDDIAGGSIARLLDQFEEPAVLLDDEDEDDPNAFIHPCLVFEVHGSPLDRLMSVTTNNGLNPRAVRILMRNILRIASQLAKRHVIHTDLKPENLLLRYPETVEDELVTAALQPTVRFVPSASSTPKMTSASQVMNKSANDFNLTPRHGTPSTSQLTPRAGGGQPQNTSIVSSRRMSLSMAGGGDGPVIPLLKNGCKPLDVVLIDFGLSYFEPIESRPPNRRSHYTNSRSQPISRDSSVGSIEVSGEYTEVQRSLLEASNYMLGVEIQTREYRAPEIILGRPFNSRTDLWSVACIAYELVTGRYLFDPKRPAHMVDDMDDSTDLKYIEDVQHLRLVTYTIGPLLTLEEGVHEEMFYSPTLEPLFDTTLTYSPDNTIMTLPHEAAGQLRDLDAEVRPFLGPMESPLFISFLMKCLKWHPNDRPDALELLDHPWLAVRPGEDI